MEQEPEELPEPAPAEETNPEQEQGKPRCIWPRSLSFNMNLDLCFIMIVH
jgi:hypothetical protein